MDDLLFSSGDYWGGDHERRRVLHDRLRRLQHFVQEAKRLSELILNDPSLPELEVKRYEDALNQLLRLDLTGRNRNRNVLDENAPIQFDISMRSRARKASKLSLEWILKKAGLLTRKELDQIKEELKRNPEENLVQALKRRRQLSDREILNAVAKELQLEMIDLRQAQISPATLALVPPSVVKEFKVLPVREEGDTIYIALSDPLDVQLQDDLEMILQRRVTAVLASDADIELAIQRYYENGEN
ncbi:hypothetical protein JXA32_05180 [Candidatus Sumerlaeota bacterium]|nr:hypothetical protein [Candidatus Sumerlaeota bacterium]